MSITFTSEELNTIHWALYEMRENIENQLEYEEDPEEREELIDSLREVQDLESRTKV